MRKTLVRDGVTRPASMWPNPLLLKPDISDNATWESPFVIRLSLSAATTKAVNFSDSSARTLLKSHLDSHDVDAQIRAMNVRCSLFIPAGFVLLGSLSAVQSEQEPALLTNPPNGSVATAPEIRAVFAPAEVLETTVTRQGDRDITVQRLALDPNDPIKPVFPTPPASFPAESAPASTYDAPSAYLLMLSATVYPGPRTFLNWSHRFANGTSREFSGWSNIDFNHFTGIATLLGTDGNQHTFVMAVGTEQAHAENAPNYATDTPTFMSDGEIPTEALVLVDSLHKIYTTEGAKLATAHDGRERARLAKEAELLANPPQPKDLIIRYRIAVTPLPTPAEGGAQ